MSFERPSSRSVYCSDVGKLYDFLHDRIVVISGYPPRGWQKTQKIPSWRPCRPQINIPKRNFQKTLDKYSIFYKQVKNKLLKPDYPYQEVKRKLSRYAWLQWYNTIPVHIRPVVAQYPNRQWHMLSFILRCGDAAYDLVQSNPALAYTLASNWLFHTPPVKQPLRSARALLKPGKKQTEILEWLGFPATKSVRKIFRKIYIKSINIQMLQLLQQIIRERTIVKTLSHLPGINRSVIVILSHPQLHTMVTHNFISDLSCAQNEINILDLEFTLTDIYEANTMLHGGRRFRINSMEELDNIHLTMIDGLNRNRNKKLISDPPFPPPPLQGNEVIIPITTAQELADEGKEQRNCALSYLTRIYKGQSFIYKVLASERATLSLEKQKGGYWMIGQLLKERNRPVSRMTSQSVEEWLLLS